MSARSVVIGLLAGVVSCTHLPANIANPPLPDTQEKFWSSLQKLCGRAYHGRLTEAEGNPGDSSFRTGILTMHVRECSSSTIRIPFHVSENRSRPFVVTRTAGGLRLKHDHRHADGSEDSVTQYGGDTRDVGTASRQEFYADDHSAKINPAYRTNVWTMEFLAGPAFAYALRREGTPRRIRVQFDLRNAVALPPPPWGAVR